MNKYRKCKKCLLNQSDLSDVYQTINDYLFTLDEESKVPDEVYKARLHECSDCDFLQSGLCLKCGCYVEMRAALKNKACANFDNLRWNKIN